MSSATGSDLTTTGSSFLPNENAGMVGFDSAGAGCPNLNPSNRCLTRSSGTGEGLDVEARPGEFESRAGRENSSKAGVEGTTASSGKIETGRSSATSPSTSFRANPNAFR
jgi:hypothetical protein